MNYILKILIGAIIGILASIIYNIIFDKKYRAIKDKINWDYVFVNIMSGIIGAGIVILGMLIVLIIRSY